MRRHQPDQVIKASITRASGRAAARGAQRHLHGAAAKREPEFGHGETLEPCHRGGGLSRTVKREDPGKMGSKAPGLCLPT